MKKLFKVLIIVLTLVILTGCQTNKISEEVKIITPQGNPYIALGNLVDEENITIDAVSGAANVKAALVAGEYDIVVAPLNIGAQLYSKGNSKYQIAGVIALGNTYIVSNKATQLSTLSDLEGKTILAYSQGGTPDIILQYVLKANNINATIEYQESLEKVVPLFVQGKYDYILAAEPVISKLQISQKKELNILNLQDYTDKTIMQAAIFVNPVSTKQDSIKTVLNKIEKNVEEMNKNTSEYVNKILNKDVYFSDLGENILNNSIPNSNLEFLNAKNNKTQIESYLEMIGYTLPSEDFYY